MTWTCPSCGRREAVPPKWCGCEPYPITAAELMGVATYELWLAGGARRRIDEAAFERLVADHQLELASGEPVAPALVKTVSTAGIEVAHTEDLYWAPLPPKAL